MRLVLALAASLALAAPAVAAPEPTTFGGTQTARVLPAGSTTVSFGAGVGLQPLLLGLSVAHGLGDRVEVLVNAAKLNNDSRFAYMGGSPPDYAGGLGLKARLGAWGAWDVAAVGHALLTSAYIFNTQVYAAVPATRAFGDLELTLAPRVFLPDLRSTSVTVGPLNAGSFSLHVGGRWRFNPAAALLFEASPGWHTSGYPGLGPRLGLRLSPWGGLHLEASGNMDLLGLSMFPGAVETTNLLSTTARYVW